MARTCPVLRAVFTPIAFLLLSILAGPVANAQTVTTLHLNEIESNGGTPDDWFELINTGTTTIGSTITTSTTQSYSGPIVLANNAALTTTNSSAHTVVARDSTVAPLRAPNAA